MKVMVVEKDGQIRSDLSLCLQVRYPGAKIIFLSDEERVLTFLDTESPDLIFLDSSVPGMDIFGLITKIRECSDAPLLILSEGETDMDRAKGLEAGADEYINSSFSPMELLARCKALLRRYRGESFVAERLVSVDGLTINLTTREVLLDGEQVSLTPIEYGLLLELAKNEGRVVTNPDLLDKVWGDEYAGDFNLVKTYVYRLRSKLQSYGGITHRIVNNRGFGYMLAKGNGAKPS